MRAEAPWILAVNALLLAERCSAHADLQKIKARILKGGTTTGRPLTAIRNELRQYILRADAELGLTPCSQNKVAALDSSKGASIQDQMFGP
jgi:phage terminase small subunit